MLLPTFLITGCGESSFPHAVPTTTRDVLLDAGVEQTSIGARLNGGVVLADRESYMIVPAATLPWLHGVHLSPPLAFRTSCDCLEAELIRYVTSSGGSEMGLLIQFIASDELITEAQALAVDIYLDGDVRGDRCFK